LEKVEKVSREDRRLPGDNNFLDSLFYFNYPVGINLFNIQRFFANKEISGMECDDEKLR